MNLYFGRNPYVLHWLHRSKTYMVVLYNDIGFCLRKKYHIIIESPDHGVSQEEGVHKDH